jgi:cytosine/creatinine deaminase
VTSESAAIMGLQGYGLAKGNRASLVVLDAGNPVEAIRLRADRMLVVANGKVVARRPKSATQLSLDGRPGSVDRRFAGHH